MKGDLHGRSLFSLYSRILHPARMHFGPFLNLPARTIALPKSLPITEQLGPEGVKHTCWGRALDPWPSCSLRFRPPAIYALSIPTMCITHVLDLSMPTTFSCHGRRRPSKGSAGFAQQPDRSKCQPCFASLLLHRVTAAGEEGAGSDCGGQSGGTDATACDSWPAPLIPCQDHHNLAALALRTPKRRARMLHKFEAFPGWFETKPVGSACQGTRDMGIVCTPGW